APRDLPHFPTRRSSDLATESTFFAVCCPMTYSSSTALISCGFGSLSRPCSARSSSSSRMMSLQSSTHSSQMNTEGPAMSLRTSRSEEHTSELQSRENLV